MEPVRPILVWNIKKNQECYDEGENITPSQLMLLVKKKYKQLKGEYIWKAQSPEEDKPITLQAKL